MSNLLSSNIIKESHITIESFRIFQLLRKIAFGDFETAQTFRGSWIDGDFRYLVKTSSKLTSNHNFVATFPYISFFSILFYWVRIQL